MLTTHKSDEITQKINDLITHKNQQRLENLDWLKKEMHPLFFRFNQKNINALSTLADSLGDIENRSRMMLLDTTKQSLLCQIDTRGSLYKTLQDLPDHYISYAELTTSRAALPNSGYKLEVLRFDYDRKQDSDIAALLEKNTLPKEILAGVDKEIRDNYPDFQTEKIAPLLNMLWCNNSDYVTVSSSKRIARILNLYTQTEENEGIFLDLQHQGDPEIPLESRLLLGLANPPTHSFLLQLLEVFNRLGISVNRSYSLSLSNGVHPYFLSTFYVESRDATKIEKDSALFTALQREIYNTQMLSPQSKSYQALVKSGITNGADASLVDAMIYFCHTNLAHNHPDSYELEAIMRAFHHHPDITTQLITLFYLRFDPDTASNSAYQKELEHTELAINNFNSGRKFLDNFRRTIFLCALAFIKHTLKTNFFVDEKHALAFRLDPLYLEALDETFTSDLPADRPFRITFFYGRNGCGYHIGFSDIARGGWRTIITQGRDDYITSANTMFKENYVLAHTQHLKNKDIYEGGSKMVAVLQLPENTKNETVQQQLYKLQFSFINAFLDVFVTKNGKAKNDRIIDYYGEDEAIELGPDENMHDVMIETIAKQGVNRGYILGAGIISSKKIGINHKEYGVTSLGVTRFAEVTMASLGIDMHKDEFSVKFTGGPNGDVAGNCMRLLQARCPKVKIKLIIDGSGALYDPQGLDSEALEKVILKTDLDGFDPSALHPGGFLLYRSQTQKQGMITRYKKVSRQEGSQQNDLQEEWVSTDNFYKTYNNLVFSVETDLFIPAGGRPETIDIGNYKKYFLGRVSDGEQGKPSARVIIEGANSFITPAARIEMQRNGVIIMRDASANKCGVISSSYEIIANLIFSDDEFLANKKCYVQDVLEILNQMSEREARLILKRHSEANGTLYYTDISNKISREINEHYDRIFEYFKANPDLLKQPSYQNAILLHLPKLIGSVEYLRNRVNTLPEKVRFAILASKLASSLVYDGDDNSIYSGMIDAMMNKFPEFIATEADC